MPNSKSTYDIDDLIALGRNMLERSEGMSTITDKTAGRANNLTRVGDLLIRLGEPFGFRIDEFNDADARFIMTELRRLKSKENVDGELVT